MTARWLGFGRAVGRWVAAGRPVRADARVAEIFDTLCRPCPQFDTASQTCRLCGCRVRRDGPAPFNKLRMATERCPDSPPKWIEEVAKR